MTKIKFHGENEICIKNKIPDVNDVGNPYYIILAIYLNHLQLRLRQPQTVGKNSNNPCAYTQNDSQFDGDLSSVHCPTVKQMNVNLNTLLTNTIDNERKIDPIYMYACNHDYIFAASVIIKLKNFTNDKQINEYYQNLSQSFEFCNHLYSIDNLYNETIFTINQYFQKIFKLIGKISKLIMAMECIKKNCFLFKILR